MSACVNSAALHPVLAVLIAQPIDAGTAMHSPCRPASAKVGIRAPGGSRGCSRDAELAAEGGPAIPSFSSPSASCSMRARQFNKKTGGPIKGSEEKPLKRKVMHAVIGPDWNS